MSQPTHDSTTHGWLSWCALWLFFIALASCSSCQSLNNIERHVRTIADQGAKP